MERLPHKKSGTVTFQKTVLSSISLLLGSTLVLLSIKVLKSDELQMDNYLSGLLKRETRPFPLQILSSVILSLTWGTGQLVFSLMFFFNEIGWRGWCWMNLTLFLIHSVSLYQISEQYGHNFMDKIHNSSTAYQTVLLINSAFAFTSILHSILVTNIITPSAITARGYQDSFD